MLDLTCKPSFTMFIYHLSGKLVMNLMNFICVTSGFRVRLALSANLISTPGTGKRDNNSQNSMSFGLQKAFETGVL